MHVLMTANVRPFACAPPAPSRVPSRCRGRPPRPRRRWRRPSFRAVGFSIAAGGNSHRLSCVCAAGRVCLRLRLSQASAAVGALVRRDARHRRRHARLRLDRQPLPRRRPRRLLLGARLVGSARVSADVRQAPRLQPRHQVSVERGALHQHPLAAADAADRRPRPRPAAAARGDLERSRPLLAERLLRPWTRHLVGWLQVPVPTRRNDLHGDRRAQQDVHCPPQHADVGAPRLRHGHRFARRLPRGRRPLPAGAPPQGGRGAVRAAATAGGDARARRPRRKRAVLAHPQGGARLVPVQRRRAPRVICGAPHTPHHYSAAGTLQAYAASYPRWATGARRPAPPAPPAWRLAPARRSNGNL
mmetsp:Transcript_31085/g.98095  ORF Transcript_31085/g.98095 Transcript_31085/m.98095 type:complete len:359 (+) Transcript_31085:393-1469(+)